MKCSCGSKTKVLDTRRNFRRRECLSCGERFWTEEIRNENARPDYSKPAKMNWSNPFAIGST